MTLLATAPLSVEELRDRAAIAALTPDWERLRAEVAAAGGTAGPFLSPPWFAIFAAALTPRDDLRLLVAHRGGRVVGLLPLMMERRHLARLPARVLRSLSDDHSQRFDVLLSPSEPQRVAAALFRHIRDLRDWDALELREIPDGPSGAALLLDAARAHGYATHDQPAMCSPFLTLPAQPGSSKFRANLRRRARKLEAELGPLSLERVTGALDAALDDGFALEKAGWKGELGTAIACDPELRRRYSQLAHAFAARGQLALSFLKAGDRRIAFHFALLENGTYYLLKPGFDPALSHYGLGHLLVDLVIKQLPIRELDFLGEDMPWKREWTERARPHSWRYVLSRSAWGRVLGTWKFGVVPELKRALRRG